MDGRVDNWQELRRELPSLGAMLRTRADAELVLRAYEVWGRDCLTHMDGDYALVIWDARRREAFCARDRLGNKPFNYHWDGRTLAFASELHPILALPWVCQTLNKGILAEFLANEWYCRDETFWQGIMRLVAGHRMSVDAWGPHLEHYWVPDRWETLRYKRDEEFIEHYRELFTEVVRRMSRCSKPLACEVSGGLDSSAIFAVAEHLRRQQELLAPALDGYTLAFPDDSDANELDYARSLGSYLGINIREVPPSRMPLSWYRDWAIRYREFPSYPNGVMGLGIRQESGLQGSRALLVGVGGDQLLCGSRRYYAETLAGTEWKTFLACLKADLSDAGLGRTLWWVFRHGCYPLIPDGARQLLRRIIIRNRRDGVDRLAWLTPSMRRLIQQRRDQYACSNREEKTNVGQRGQVPMLSDAYLAHALELEERMAASERIELRRPFFDSNLVRFAFTTPQRLKLQGRTDKYLHRRAMTGLITRSILQRETKAEFSITFRWYLPQLRELVTQDTSYRQRDWVRPRKVAKLLSVADHIEHSSVPAWMLWSLFGCQSLDSMPESAE
jgi:asparagine synthase (glutamine-hydrolysing)